MNYNWSINKDDWRMKVWNKTLIFKTSSWPTLICETIQEIRQVNIILFLSEFFSYLI